MIDQKKSVKRSSQQDLETSKNGFNRRGFLGGGTLAATAALLQGCTDNGNGGEPEPIIEPGGEPVICFEAFSQPAVVASQNQEARAQWRVETTNFTYRCGNQTQEVPNSRTFSSSIPAPTFLIDPGDKIRINLENRLIGTKNCSPDAASRLNHPACFNTVNIHFHGLHVSPSSYCIGDENVLSSDDVLFEMPPWDGQGDIPNHDWCVWLPEFHAPGTHWYHAHRHGSTALQVSNGMVGAIIIREPSTELNIVDPSEDKVWIIHEIIQPRGDGDPDEAIYQEPGLNRGVTAGDFLVNGKCKPTITLKAGQIQRWRFVNGNGTPRGLMNLKLCRITENCDTRASCGIGAVSLAPMWLIAVDGISFYGQPPRLIGRNILREPGFENVGLDGWDFAPGNRADFLVRLPAGRYKLLKDFNSTQGGSTNPQILAYVEVEEATGFDENIPQIVPGSFAPYERYLKPITDDDLTNKENDGEICPRVINFSVVNNGPKGYKINDQLYCPDCANIEVNLGDVEEWELTNEGGPIRGPAHPFHIHVNPFQIVERHGIPIPEAERIWWDVIAVAPGDNIKIRHRFVDYPGVFVIHCHILIHEDQGMMMNVHVKPTDSDPGTPPCFSLNNQGQSQPSPEIPPGAVVCPPPSACPPLEGVCTEAGTNSNSVVNQCPTS